MYKIAILYICTGKYALFFDDFYKSSEKFLLANYNKQYFVWTDNLNIGDGLPNVQIIHHKCAGFPLDSLFRFEMFLQVEKELKNYDYIYFFNANSEFRQPVNEEILPDETGLAMGIWGSKQLKRPACLHPYERNKKSLAYVAPYGKNYIYFMGGLNGGASNAYLEMIHTLAANIRYDYDRGIIAKVHDESHINAYMRTHKCKILPEYLNRPAEDPTSTSAKMVFRKKTTIDPYFNKGRKSTFIAKSIKAAKMLVNAIRWYLYI